MLTTEAYRLRKAKTFCIFSTKKLYRSLDNSQSYVPDPKKFYMNHDRYVYAWHTRFGRRPRRSHMCDRNNSVFPGTLVKNVCTLSFFDNEIFLTKLSNKVTAHVNFFLYYRGDWSVLVLTESILAQLSLKLQCVSKRY